MDLLIRDNECFDPILRKLQLTQLEMLKLIDRICRDNDIQYSLYAGTLLGAVRHNGFIPWDDDLDVCMPRKDYDKFLKIWEQISPAGYILQNKENSPNYMNSYSKIRKDHTTFLEHKEDAGRFHTGIFVDVFPIDRIPKSRIKRLLFYWNCMYYQLLTREYAPGDNGKVVRFFANFLLATNSVKSRVKKREKLLQKFTAYNENNDYEVVFTEIISTMLQSFKSTLLDSFSDVQFEDGIFKCFSDSDYYLTAYYGNYMKLPPKEERVLQHRPLIIDFEHNYEEIERA